VKGRRVLVVALALGGAWTFGVPGAGACTLWASDRGNDGNPGTAEAPFRNVQRLVDHLHPGQVGCLAPGSIFAEEVRIGRSGIELRSGPGRRATIRGGIRVFAGADNVVLSSLVIQGADVGQRGIVVLEANWARVFGSEISGPFLLNRSAPCVLLDGVVGAILDRNSIHNCSRVTKRTTYSAGVVIANATSTTVSNSLVFRTAGDGIVLAPNAQGSLLHHNVIDGNVGGVFLGGSSSGNRILNNVISFSGRYNVHASYRADGSPDNLLSGNCLWKGTLANLAGAGHGFRASGNVVASPRYVNRYASLAMRPGPCYLNRPLSAQGRGRYAVMPKFRVRYKLRALPDRVQVLDLKLIGLMPGVEVDVRCARGCRGGERLLAGPRGTASSSSLLGRWLRRGAVIDVRARAEWWVGHYARVKVTGLPRGVKIFHACLPPTGSGTPVSCGRYR
jgi:hypothetical protein